MLKFCADIICLFCINLCHLRLRFCHSHLLQAHFGDSGGCGKCFDQTALRESVDCRKCFDQEAMAGMAGASEDGAYLWQIGINVVPECAGKGLAAELVRSLKNEIIRRGKVPFYGTSESHTISQTVALKAGFVPAWTEIYVCRRKESS